jgi:hypothetical protein
MPLTSLTTEELKQRFSSRLQYIAETNEEQELWAEICGRLDRFERTRKVLDAARTALVLATNAFEKNWCIDWDVVSGAINLIDAEIDQKEQ